MNYKISLLSLYLSLSLSFDLCICLFLSPVLVSFVHLFYLYTVVICIFFSCHPFSSLLQWHAVVVAASSTLIVSRSISEAA
jgi:hypothetical protein